MTADHPDEPTVPVSDLRELVEEWEMFADTVPASRYGNGVHDGVRSCKDKVEELVAEYE